MRICKDILIVGLVTLASSFGIRSCSVTESCYPYMQGEYKGARYAFARNGIIGQTYTIIVKDGTRFRCDDLGYNLLWNTIDSVIVYDKNGRIQKIYENSIINHNDENDKFLKQLTSNINEARTAISGKKEAERIVSLVEQKLQRKKQLEQEQTDLLNKLE